MKVLLVNGSPKANGNTSIALNEMIKVFEAEGVETKYLHIGNKVIRGCVACQSCFQRGKCVFDDVVNEIAPYFMEAEGFVIGAPVYFASPNGTALAFLDRLFYSTFTQDKTMKVGAGVVICRRGGASSSFDVLNKYFAITGMAIAGSQYWNMVYGLEKGEATQDAEGLQTMRTL
ncbi:MAG: flavodoxin family protein, partial [Selenomonadaceae bacterium]|nr:flavodoxin family protein [Selenomonadaceae bacterium]